MNPHNLVYIAALTVIFLILPPPGACRAGAPEQDARETSANLPVYVYFADEAHMFLTGEQRTAPLPEDPVASCRYLVNELIRGPRGNLTATIPKNTKLRALFLGPDKTAYVDLSEDVRTGLAGGIKTELLAVYSIVDTLVLNVPEVEQVKILIDGGESETLSGHIDIRFPFKADILLIR